MKEITLQVPDGKRVEWKEVNGQTVPVLVDEETKDNRPVTERIKTLADAMEALGQGNPLVEEYIAVRDKLRTDAGDLIAYLKLRIIVAALNEGWEPKFTKDEYRYFPWFSFYTKKEYEELDEDEKKESRVVVRLDYDAYSYGGTICSGANGLSSYSYAYFGYRIALKTRVLAEYCGKQFLEVWADFVFKPYTGEQLRNVRHHE